MSKQWVLREQVSSDIVRQILFYRGIKENEEMEKFLNPDYERDLYDPFEILNMEKAVERILKAIENNERIIVLGDYDADGVCASVIFHDFFKKIGFENFHIHIPDRHLDGYGLTKEAIEEFIEQRAGLIITLDCGITDVEEVDKAKEAKIDVIIIDHHLPPEKLPDAFVIIDTKQKNDNYPFKDLCGAGVAFKTIQALIKKGSASRRINIVSGWEKWLLDLVSIATIADMVPLVGENRVLAHYGLQVLKKTRRPGLLSFFRRLDMSPSNIMEDDIAFMIAPRINISSRMDHANLSFELLTTSSASEADWITSRLEGFNLERRKIVDEILGQIDKEIAGQKRVPEIIVAGDFRWNTGVLGLLANRLVEKYSRPVFLWGKAGAKEIKGSCRSDGSVNLVKMMNLIPKDILRESGGHVMAGGFSLAEGKEEDFKKGVISAFKKIPKQDVKNNILYIDKEISLDEINSAFYSLLEKLQPFGIDNPRPVFLLSNLEIANVKKFGNGGIHLQLDFRKNPPAGGGGVISAISFFSNGNGFDFKVNDKVDLAASLEKSFFRIVPELRLRLVDIKLKQ